jgi:hypothetical protein
MEEDDGVDSEVEVPKSPKRPDVVPEGLAILNSFKTDQPDLFSQYLAQSFLQCVLEIWLFREKLNMASSTLDFYVEGPSPKEKFKNKKSKWSIMK